MKSFDINEVVLISIVVFVVGFIIGTFLSMWYSGDYPDAPKK